MVKKKRRKEAEEDRDGAHFFLEQDSLNNDQPKAGKHRRDNDKFGGVVLHE